MFLEVVLDAYSEDPVNVLVIRQTDKKVGAEDDGYPGEDVYLVEHIFESRGSRDVQSKMEIRVPSEVE